MNPKNYALTGIPVPMIKHRADPWVYKHVDGYYYFTATVPEYDRIELRRSTTLAGLIDAETKDLWKKRDKGILSSHIWAPEIHYIKGKWYIYFAAGASDNVWDIHKYVLENSSPNPMEGEWVEKGRIDTGDSNFTLDATVFQLKEKFYLVWAQKPSETPLVSNLYIAELENPWTIKGEPVLLSRPEYYWEIQLFAVNEGPAVLIRQGEIFLAYSASGTDYHYCMGLLTASADSDPLLPESWTKSPEPVFQSSDDTNVYGPGHCCFTKFEESDVLVYHAREYKEIEGDPLDDPNRHCRMQKIFWNSLGKPDFGVPLAATEKKENQ